MASQDRLQSRLRSLGELRGIVGTMKSLSAVSIHQYERAAQAAHAYVRTVERGLTVALRGLPDASLPAGNGDGGRAYVVFGSDHGLCGRFNEAVVGRALDALGADRSAAPPSLIAVGDQATALLADAGRSPAAAFRLPGSAAGITATVQALLVKLEGLHAPRGLERLEVFHHRQAEAQADALARQVLLPLGRARLAAWRDRPWPSRRLPTFSMDRERLLRRLVRQYLLVALYVACAESQAREHASRLAAMQSAQRNLDERLEEVTAAYRRARQDAITAELLDVIAGFEATRDPAARAD